MSSATNRGYTSRRSSSAAPSARLRNRSSTGIRVPRITGLPCLSPQYCSLKYLDVVGIVDGTGGGSVARTKREVAHLALDAPWHLATAARHDSFFQDLGEHRLMKRFSVLRGE